MNKSEIDDLLKSHEQQKIRIRVKVAFQRKDAQDIYFDIYRKLRDTTFKSNDEMVYAYKEAAKFIEDLYEPFRRD